MDGPLVTTAAIATVLSLIFAVAAFLVQRKRREAGQYDAPGEAVQSPQAVHQATSKVEEPVVPHVRELPREEFIQHDPTPPPRRGPFMPGVTKSTAARAPQTRPDAGDDDKVIFKRYTASGGDEAAGSPSQEELLWE